MCGRRDPYQPVHQQDEEWQQMEKLQSHLYSIPSLQIIYLPQTLPSLFYIFLFMEDRGLSSLRFQSDWFLSDLAQSRFPIEVFLGDLQLLELSYLLNFLMGSEKGRPGFRTSDFGLQETVNSSVGSLLLSRFTESQIHYQTNSKSPQLRMIFLFGLAAASIEQAAKVDYPVRFAYIDKINRWWPPQAIAAEIGVPGYGSQKDYNYIALAFWSYASGALDIVNIWADPIKYFSSQNPFGTTNDQIQKTLKAKYNAKGIKILISAFGATEFPTTAGYDPVDCATKLAKFVSTNNLDGVDIDWEDNGAMEQGRGQNWLISFSKKLRELLPNHIITHAPQGPYFKQEFYRNGAYIKVNKEVGALIDFYNVQFYNQGNTKYNTYDQLFLKSTGPFDGTSVHQIIARGVPAKKIVVGKPVTPADATNSGYVDMSSLGGFTSRAYKQMGWFGGVMLWQWSSDGSGSQIVKATGGLVQQCKSNNNCK